METRETPGATRSGFSTECLSSARAEVGNGVTNTVSGRDLIEGADRQYDGVDPGGAANVKVLDITGLTIPGTTPFAGDGGKDLGGLASPAPVPEPGTIGLLVVGVLAGLLLRRRNQRSITV